MAVILKHDFTEDIDPNWLLQEGQVGIQLIKAGESTNYNITTPVARLKVGDGATPWNQLGYASPDPRVYQDTMIMYPSSTRAFQIQTRYGLDMWATSFTRHRARTHEFFQHPTAGTPDVDYPILRISRDGLMPDSRAPKAIGSSSAAWASVWTQTGTVQTSERASKDSIRYLDETVLRRSSNDSLNTESVVDLVSKLRPATFCYKHDSHDEEPTSQCEVQLGLIADDIKDHPAYKYIGINQFDEELGRNRLGLQPLPLAVAALTVCKHLLDENQKFREELNDIKRQLKAEK